MGGKACRQALPREGAERHFWTLSQDGFKAVLVTGHQQLISEARIYREALINITKNTESFYVIIEQGNYGTSH